MVVMVIMMMMAAGGSVMVMMIVHERQRAAGSDGGLLDDRCRGCRDGKAYCCDCGDNNLPDAHEILPESREGQPPRNARIVAKLAAAPLVLKSNVARVSRGARAF